MPRYIAFLRGINVGGKNIIKMETLKKSFEVMGFKNVKTFIQSGNVLFVSSSQNAVGIIKKIENALLNEYNDPIKVMLRTTDEIEKIIRAKPFRSIKEDNNTKLYVCFSAEELKPKPAIPKFSEKESCEVVAIESMEVFIISRRMKNGRYGFPNSFIEKELGKSFTARNWNTVCRIVGFKMSDI